MAVRSDSKPFLCTYSGCGQGFATEDRLVAHSRSHEPILHSLSFGFTDQTPTPTTFFGLKDCESALFQELRNPFDESFKRVNSYEALPLSGPADTMTTPSIIPCRTAEDDEVNEASLAGQHLLQYGSLSDSSSQCNSDLSVLVDPQVPISAGSQVVSSTPSSGPVPSKAFCHVPVSAGSNITSRTMTGGYVSITNVKIPSAAPLSSTAAMRHSDEESSRLVAAASLLMAQMPGSSVGGGALSAMSSVSVSAASDGGRRAAVSSGDGEAAAGSPPSSCTMQLILQLPTGQTVPINIPAAIMATPATSTGGGLTSTVAATTSWLSPDSTPVSPLARTVAASGSGAAGTNKVVEVCGMSLATKQKMKEALQRREGVVNGSGSPTGGWHVQTMYKLGLGQQPSDQCVGSTTGGMLRRPRHSSSDDDPEDKRVKFLERNREAARRCRSKKKEWITNLEQRNDELQNSQQRLQTEIMSLRSEVAELKCLLLEHKDCPVTLKQKLGGRLTFVDGMSPAQPQSAGTT